MYIVGKYIIHLYEL